MPVHSGRPKLLSGRWIFLTMDSISLQLEDAKGATRIDFTLNPPLAGYAVDSLKIAPNQGTRLQCLKSRSTVNITF